MEFSSLSLIFLLIGFFHCSLSQHSERPKPTVIINPGGAVFRGEPVKLICIIHDDKFSEWQYSWYKDGSDAVISTDRVYTISHVTETHSGNYTCRGSDHRGSSHISDAVALVSEDVFICESPGKADIVILIDGSWSIGRLNFRTLKTFLKNLVGAFSVNSDQTRIGLVQYSNDPRVEWHLNTHSTKDDVINAVVNLRFKGGSTLTGLALMFAMENSFKPESGLRTGVPKVGILVTDRKSQDGIIDPAQQLRDAGIEMFAIGVKNADENELKTIASPPEKTHVYNVADFSALNSILEGLTKTVCERIEQREKEIKVESAPRDLVTSDITARSFRVSWTHAPGTVEKYKVVYNASGGGKPEEVVVNGDQNSVLLQHLNSMTKYEVAVFAVHSNSSSEALRGSETTQKPKPTVMINPGCSGFRGEPVKLTCNIQDYKVSEWQYSWYKDGSDAVISTDHVYTISHVTETHSGKYTCRGSDDRGSSYISDAVDVLEIYQQFCLEP